MVKVKTYLFQETSGLMSMCCSCKHNGKKQVTGTGIIPLSTKKIQSSTLVYSEKHVFDSGNLARELMRNCFLNVFSWRWYLSRKMLILNLELYAQISDWKYCHFHDICLICLFFFSFWPEITYFLQFCYSCFITFVSVVTDGKLRKAW